MTDALEGPGQPELRLALVLNGGVSLAVWMSGVTREIDALQHAHQAIPEDFSEAQRNHAAVWEEVLTASRRPRVTVDVIAGTSAGGLNGALLGSAIARGTRLGSDLRDLWVEAGSLKVDKLIQAKDSKERSLLGGKFFEEQILGALGLTTDESGSITMSSPTSGTENCILLTTATALRRPAPDEVGPDSRRVYRFRHRVDEEGTAVVPDWAADDFSDFATALATAARASASFPAAFNPVFENADLVERRVDNRNKAASHLVDGGVLDNAPFGPILSELRKRPVGARFDRSVIYVKPSAGGSGNTDRPLGDNPPVVRVLGKVVSASREPDDRQDAQELGDLQDAMRYSGTSPHLLVSRCWETTSSLPFQNLVASAQGLINHYRHSRQQAMNLPFIEFPLTNVDPDPDAPLPPATPPFSNMQLSMTRDSWTWGGFHCRSSVALVGAHPQLAGV